MRKLALALPLAILANSCRADGGAAARPAPERRAPARPHVVHIVADDLGWKDVGFHGSDIRTPSLDALAASGVELASFYVQPLCTPTRACLMTGRYPFRYGLQTLVIPSSGTYGLPTDEWLMPQALKEAGYATAIVGKWHLGHGARELFPGARGFERQYGPLIGEIDYFTHRQHGVLDWFRDGEPLEEEGYSTDLIGAEAVRVIEQHDPAKPLYLYLTFNAPHAPYQAPEEDLARYAHVADPSRRAYAAMVTAMDEEIGRVLATLEKKGMRDDTLVLFHSDNGGTRNARFSGEIDTSSLVIPCDNGPYREGKGTLYEGGTRAVALASWPSRLPAGGRVEGLIHAVDVYPTIAALAGASTARCKPLDGIDVWPTIAEGAEQRTEIVYGVESLRAALRQGDWKLVWRTPLPSSVELYDLASDPSESRDLAARHPEKVAALQARIEELAATATKSTLLQTELAAMLERLAMPPALPGRELEFDQEH